MHYTYGKSFDYLFYLQDHDGNELDASSDAPEIKLWSDRPGRDAVLAGSGTPLQTKTSWSDSGDGIGKKVTFDPVSDPDATGGVVIREFWVSAKYKLETTGEFQAIIQKVVFSRAISQDSVIGCDAPFVVNICSRIGKAFTSAQIESFIKIGIEELKIDFEEDGKKWSQLLEVSRFKLVAAYKAIEVAAIDKRKRDGDKWDKLAKEYGTRASNTMIEITAPYDSDRDGEVDTETEGDNDYQIVPR